jgi:hypothetical protein
MHHIEKQILTMPSWLCHVLQFDNYRQLLFYNSDFLLEKLEN